MLDDDPSVVTSIAAILEMANLRTLTSNDADEALRLTRHFYPNMIVADVNMPRKNGLEFLQQLHSEGLFDIPVIFVSAMARYENIQAGLNAGAKQYLTKPFTPEQLMMAVEKHLRVA